MDLMRRQSGVPSFSELLDDFFLRELNPSTGRWPSRSMPSVNISETADKFMLELAAPGMTKGDFKLEVTPANQLVISSEKKEETEQKGDSNGNPESKRFTMKEFSYSSFRRSFTLPDHADADKIEANYKDGVLSVSIPKRPEAPVKSARTIAVK